MVGAVGAVGHGCGGVVVLAVCAGDVVPGPVAVVADRCGSAVDGVSGGVAR